MRAKVILPAFVLALCSFTDAYSQGASNNPNDAQYPPQVGRFWVQFRQPYWREQQFRSRAELNAFVEENVRNGWEVQVLPGNRVSTRLWNWGGSQILNTYPEAVQWAANLQAAGWETRIVNYP